MNSPGLKRAFEAQPTIKSRCAGSSPFRTGCSARIGANDSISIASPSQPCDLFRHVDPRRAPCDAAPATDASVRAELVDPGRELVHQPLAVASPHAGPDAAAVDVGELVRETGIPPPPPLDEVPRQVRAVLDGVAEAGGAGHRAVRAGEAALRDFVPLGML